MRKTATLAAFLLAAAFARAESATVRAEFTSVPSGASVAIDGKPCGATPTSAYLPANVAHQVSFALAGYEPEDTIFTPDTSLSKTCHCDMKPVKGLLLVTSEPEGAEITVDGYSLGETPRLITTLDARNVHYLLLRKNGYLERKLEVKFYGRKPLVHNVKLPVDSGTVEVKTDPEGADVILNGVSRGKTPVSVSNIPKGRISIVLRKKGYSEETRDISVPAGEVERVFVTMEELPGSLNLLSRPEGARFYVDGHAEGRAPVSIKKIKAGTHTIRAELDGHAPVEKTVKVERGKALTEEFVLSNILGRLEIVSNPPGAVILLDGKPAGSTRSGTPGAEESDILTIPDVKEGPHTVAIRKRGYAEARKNVTVESSKAVQIRAKLRKLFIPNIRVTTDTGVIEGILESQNENTMFIRIREGILYPVPRINIRGEPEMLDSEP